ncbi:MAG: electron transport complex subunit E [Christensenellaceae bacterium]|jgi:electron transport complex, rnfABCDGE type, E subunit|nr:electron transport complex subunit E [Christensenellaceae bacterium]MBS6564200.1 electron transport complex subunit E [Clostridiales bacterium]PWL99885.1 MAG: electron transport complex subunit RsxE [Selenomonadales bacterium]
MEKPKGKSLITIFKEGAITNNPTFVMVLGMCPTLAVTTSAFNGLGMGVSVIFVLLCSSLLVSMLRKFIPEQVRIPCFIVVIASFSTIVQMLLEAFLPSLNASLGIFIPLIVVNCIILERAESFASKNGLLASAADALGTGSGFTIALTILGCIRELLGSGSIFGLRLLPEGVPAISGFTMTAGGFITLGVVLAVLAAVRNKRGNKA